MATWTNIPDDVLEPGKPIRSVDALALRDNAIAIADGAAGAPRIQTPAIASNAVTNAKMANSSVQDPQLGGSATNAGRNWIMNRLALHSANRVGGYALLRGGSGNEYGTAAGSSLQFAGAISSANWSRSNDYPPITWRVNAAAGGSPGGTWRRCGRAGGDAGISPTGPGSGASVASATLWIRIA